MDDVEGGLEGKAMASRGTRTERRKEVGTFKGQGRSEGNHEAVGESGSETPGGGVGCKQVRGRHSAGCLRREPPGLRWSFTGKAKRARG